MPGGKVKAMKKKWGTWKYTFASDSGYYGDLKKEKEKKRGAANLYVGTHWIFGLDYCTVVWWASPKGKRKKTLLLALNKAK